MSDEASKPQVPEAGEWPIRPALLAAIGAAAALAVQQLLDRSGSPPPLVPLSIAIGIGTTATGFGFVAGRRRLSWAVGFALSIGLIAALIVHWQGIPGGAPGFWNWRLASLFLAIAIACPLFQTARDEGRWRLPYAELHSHAWTNVVLWFAGWIFVGVVFAMGWLLAALFNLIKIDLLEKLLEKDWFMATLAGAAFGGAIGLMRERDRIVRLLQRVVTAVLGVLAPVLAIGLLLFLLALPFAGLGALWEATRSTTPILLSCVIGALILANAVIGNGTDDETRGPALRYGALGLGAVMLPLVVIAAIATGLRIDQYGFTPDRLWALIFIIIASAYGLAYLAALVRGQIAWAPFARSANVTLGVAVAPIGLFLATPIVSFNALSAKDQVARLRSGRVAPEKVDWAALAFDFGEPGRAALKRLATSTTPAIARLARAAQRKTTRYALPSPVDTDDSLANLAGRLRILPHPAGLPLDLQKLLLDWRGCGDGQQGRCTVLFTAGAGEALAFRDRCLEQLMVAPPSGPPSSDLVTLDQSCPISRYRKIGSDWRLVESGQQVRPGPAAQAALKAGIDSEQVEIRTAPRRQLFVGGVPVGDPFE
ncbi:MAG: DUF4153 domain-containing protein [Sphingomonas sp. 28-66-16]|nr:MAG: DUF4153 domain-containing protein [Sphingomonas sp. 28-66-16]